MVNDTGEKPNNTDSESKIPWKNIYHMLIYDIKSLDKLNFEDINSENIQSIKDILAELLLKSLDLIRPTGFYREHTAEEVLNNKPTSMINIKKSIETSELFSGNMYSTKFNFGVDNTYNQIIKTALGVILGFDQKYIQIISENQEFTGDTSKITNEQTEIALINYYKQLINSGVQSLDKPYELDLQLYSRAPKYYRYCLSASHLVLKLLLAKDELGTHLLVSTKSKLVLRYIFQNFLLNFYNDQLNKEGIGEAIQLNFKMDRGETSRYRKNYTDTVILLADTFVVLDAKWYEGKYLNKANNIRQVIDYGISILDAIQLEGNIGGRVYGKDGEDLHWFGLIIYAEPSDEARDKIRHAELDRLKDITNIPFSVFLESLNLNKDFQEIQDNLMEILNNTINNKLSLNS